MPGLSVTRLGTKQVFCDRESVATVAVTRRGRRPGRPFRRRDIPAPVSDCGWDEVKATVSASSRFRRGISGAVRSSYVVCSPLPGALAERFRMF